jgi:hypothetical protein
MKKNPIGLYLFVILFLCTGMSWAGVVIDGETGFPVSDVFVHYEYNTYLPSPGGAVKFGEGGSKNALTDVDGQYDLGFRPDMIPAIGFEIRGSIETYKKGYFGARVINRKISNKIILHKIRYKNDYLNQIKWMKNPRFLHSNAGDKSDQKNVINQILNGTYEQFSETGVFLKVPGSQLSKLDGPFRTGKTVHRLTGSSITSCVDFDQWYLRVFDENSSNWLIFDSQGNSVDENTLWHPFDYKRNFDETSISKDQTTIVFGNCGVKADTLPGANSESRYIFARRLSHSESFAIVATSGINRLYILQPNAKPHRGGIEIKTDIAIRDGLTHFIDFPTALNGWQFIFIYNRRQIVHCAYEKPLRLIYSEDYPPPATCKQIDLDEILNDEISSICYSFSCSSPGIYLTTDSDTVYRFDTDFNPDYQIRIK